MNRQILRMVKSVMWIQPIQSSKDTLVIPTMFTDDEFCSRAKYLDQFMDVSSKVLRCVVHHIHLQNTWHKGWIKPTWYV